MRNQFNSQLEQLNTALTPIGAMCEEAISSAAKALLENDVQLQKKTLVLRSDIKQSERSIEALCMKLLLQQQPVAGDLRTISSALRIISDMERIGDQASDIAERAPFINQGGGTGRVRIADMARAVIKMVTDSIDSFVHKDLELAESVVAYDDVVDGIFSSIKNELIALMNSDIQNSEVCIDLIITAKYFERIGDHAASIAEWVEFSLTAKHSDII